MLDARYNANVIAKFQIPTTRLTCSRSKKLYNYFHFIDRSNNYVFMHTILYVLITYLVKKHYMIYPYYASEWLTNAVLYSLADSVCRKGVFYVQNTNGHINVSGGFFQFNITIMFIYYTCLRNFSFQYYCC